MSYRVRMTIVCDATEAHPYSTAPADSYPCTNTFTTDTATAGEARLLAKWAGWWASTGGRDLCPTHHQ